MPTTPITQQLAEKLIDAALDSDASGRPDGALADLALQLRASYRQQAEAPGQTECPACYGEGYQPQQATAVCRTCDGTGLVAQAPAVPAPLPQQAEGARPVAWRDHVEERLRSWRQRFVNKSGDQLALDDFMDHESLDDLLDFVLDEYVGPPAVQPLVQREDTLAKALEEACHEATYSRELLTWAHTKLHYRSFDNMDDALQLDRIKLYLEHGIAS